VSDVKTDFSASLTLLTQEIPAVGSSATLSGSRTKKPAAEKRTGFATFSCISTAPAIRVQIGASLIRDPYNWEFVKMSDPELWDDDQKGEIVFQPGKGYVCG
jgi:hypothetical protein